MGDKEGDFWATNRLPRWGKGIERRWIWLRRIYSWAAPNGRQGGGFLGYKQVAPLGQGYRTEVDLVAQGMFMGHTDGETGWGILGYKQVAPMGQGYRMVADSVARAIHLVVRLKVMD